MSENDDWEHLDQKANTRWRKPPQELTSGHQLELSSHAPKIYPTSGKDNRGPPGQEPSTRGRSPQQTKISAYPQLTKLSPQQGRDGFRQFSPELSSPLPPPSHSPTPAPELAPTSPGEQEEPNMDAVQPGQDRGSYFTNALARLKEGPSRPATTTKTARSRAYTASAVHRLPQLNGRRGATGAMGMTKLDFSVAPSTYRTRRTQSAMKKPFRAPTVMAMAQGVEGNTVVTQVTKKRGMTISKWREEAILRPRRRCRFMSTRE